MQKLILVRHSVPEIDARLRAADWHLSDEGRRRCTGLAEALRAARFAVVHVEGPEGVAMIPDALEALFTGYFSP